MHTMRKCENKNCLTHQSCQLKQPFFKKVTNKYNKNFFKKRKRIDAIKGGKQEVTEIDDIIHNSSYRQSDSAFF